MPTTISYTLRHFTLTAVCWAAMAAPAALAAPVSVLLHPAGALVHEEFTLTPAQDGRTLRFQLPPDADTRSIDVTAANHVITSISFRDSIAPDEEPVLSLKRDLEKVRADIRSLQTLGGDADAYRDLWRHPPVTLNSPTDLPALADLTARRLAAFDDGREARLAKLQTPTEQEALLVQRLEEAGGSGFAREAIITLDRNAGGPVKINCVYNARMPGGDLCTGSKPVRIRAL